MEVDEVSQASWWTEFVHLQWIYRLLILFGTWLTQLNWDEKLVSSFEGISKHRVSISMQRLAKVHTSTHPWSIKVRKWWAKNSVWSCYCFACTWTTPATKSVIKITSWFTEFGKKTLNVGNGFFFSATAKPAGLKWLLIGDHVQKTGGGGSNGKREAPFSLASLHLDSRWEFEWLVMSRK